MPEYMPEYCFVNRFRDKTFEFKDMPKEYLKRVPMRFYEGIGKGYIVHDGALYDMIGEMILRVYPAMKN
ncbi:MAG: hypothetical protein HZB65_00665 [Candidatus Aenigmarchaeota archaeon]|nr:hypothetical protein [Candidatus Aenigmarchaeota archaeon]